MKFLIEKNYRRLKRKKKWIERNGRLIKDNFKCQDFCFKSIKFQLNCLREKNENFKFINRETYRKFIIDKKLVVFKRFDHNRVKSNSIENKKIRIITIRLLFELLQSNYNVIFFDQTVISDFSFKKSAWISSNDKKKFTVKKSFKSVKMLALVDMNEFLSIRFYRNVNSETILKFLENSIFYLIETKGFNNIVIFLDNSPSNRSEMLFDFCRKNNIILFYNAFENPYANIVEQFFEFLKRDIRNSIFKSDYQTIYELLLKTKLFTKKNLDFAFQKEFRNFEKILSEIDL